MVSNEPQREVRNSALPDDHEAVPVPLGGTRAQNVQRLQVGISGIAVMILLVGLASVVIEQARLNEDTVATIEGEPVVDATEEVPATPSDPLNDLGVVPDLPAETPTPAAEAQAPQPATVPAGRQGASPDAQ